MCAVNGEKEISWDVILNCKIIKYLEFYDVHRNSAYSKLDTKAAVLATLDMLEFYIIQKVVLVGKYILQT